MFDKQKEIELRERFRTAQLEKLRTMLNEEQDRDINLDGEE